MKVSIIIPCYWANEELYQMTIKCLNSLNDTTDTEPSEVLIINDGSPLNPHLIDETNFVQQFKQIDRKKNGGYVVAVNTGLYHATGDVIIVANNDLVFIDPNWLKELLRPLREGYDISSIRVSDADGWTVEDRYEENAKFGSIFAMKRGVYEKLGGFDEYFKGYFTDLDYRRKALNAGFRIVKNHAGLVEHIGKATYKQVDPEDREYWEMKERFMEKWGFVE